VLVNEKKENLGVLICSSRVVLGYISHQLSTLAAAFGLPSNTDQHGNMDKKVEILQIDGLESRLLSLQ